MHFKKNRYLSGAMKTLRIPAVVLLTLGWAQQLRLEKLPSPREVRIPATLLRSPQARTQNLGWLLPNQSYMTVPAPTNDPDYAGDTLISNGVGPNTRSNPPTACLGTFFDSLDAVGAYLIIGNERLQVTRGGGIPNPCDNLFLDGAIAERYDIDPDLGGADRTVSIKGIAAWIVNFGGSSGNCNPQLSAPDPDDGDNAYTLTYSLYNVKTQNYNVVYSPPRTGTAPDQPIRTTTRPISDVRIGNAAFNESGPNCPSFTNTQNPHLAEVFDFAYFDTPVDITDSTSYYVVIATERYNVGGTSATAPPAYTLTDTLYFLYGPTSSLGLNNHPCYNADTVRPGRSLLSWALYDTCSGSYSGLLSDLGSFPDWVPMHALYDPPLNRGLNWIAFPIVYAQTLTTGMWIHGDQQSIMTPYPNPAVDCINLRLRGDMPAQVEAQLYTLDGRWVKAWPTQHAAAGEVQLTLDTGDVPAGTYLLRVQSERARAAFQVTILR